MDEHDGPRGEVAARLAALEAENEELRARCDRLEALARGQETAAAPPARRPGLAVPPAPPNAGGTVTTSVSRRGMLLGGVGAAAAMVALAAEPAAAASGDVQLGVINTASATTEITAVLAGVPTLNLLNTDTDTAGPALYAQSGASSGEDIPAGAVVATTATSAGVVGLSDAQAGVYGASTQGAGVRGAGSGESGPGVWGSHGPGTGVLGSSSEGVGVSATSDNGTALEAEGQTGGTFLGHKTQLKLVLQPSRGAPILDTSAHDAGSLCADGTGTLWYCGTSATPGRWVEVAGPTSAGAFHLLPSPVRLYDSRPGTSPATGPKDKLQPGVARLLPAASAAGVPAQARGLMINMLVVNATPGDANLTVWAQYLAKPSANAMVWGGSTGRVSSLVVTAISVRGGFNVACSTSTDIVVDVVGYYR